jgi:hypothetical protein
MLHEYTQTHSQVRSSKLRVGVKGGIQEKVESMKKKPLVQIAVEVEALFRDTLLS